MRDYLNVVVNSSKIEILVVGGGFVGLTLAAKLLQNSNTNLVVLENNLEKISKFRIKEYGIFEPGLDEAFNSGIDKNRLRFVSDLSELKFDLAFICINTSKGELNRIDKLSDLIDTLIKHLVNSGHIYLRSTVPVGTTTKIHKSLKASLRNDIMIFYAPERTAEGMALIELDSLPQIIGSPVLGEVEIGTKMLSSLGFEVIETGNSDSAEFIKCICNIWRDTTFAISNEFAMFAEDLNLDIFEIIEKANFRYPRSKIPKPGPVGGPCLSKDTYLFLESLSKVLANDSIILKSRKQNENLVNIASKVISDFVSNNTSQDKVCFLGAAFKGKPRTNDFRNSFTQELIHVIKDKNFEIRVWDPTLISGDLFEYSVYFEKELRVKDTNIVVIGNNADFIIDTYALDFLKSLPPTALIVDMWGVTRDIENIEAQIYRFGIKA
jgi:UDP-N-acetyl-D-mannosaminuronic acid dehydrogenase